MSNTGSSTFQMSEEINDFPSLDLAFDLTKERITQQIEQVDALDTKANFIVGSSTAFISAALVLQAVLLPVHVTTPANKFLQSLPLLLLLVIFIAVLTSAFFAYNLRSYKRVPNPSELYKNYLREPEQSTKAQVFRAMVEAFKRNEEVIRRKVFWTRLALVFLGCEAMLLVVFLFFQTVL